MSGIYIPGLAMPTNCLDCPVYWDKCPNWDAEGNEYLERIHPDCPLVPVPEHGRLIDADALAEHKFVCIPHVIVNDKEAGTAYRLGWNTAIEAIMENAETIIGGE